MSSRAGGGVNGDVNRNGGGGLGFDLAGDRRIRERVGRGRNQARAVASRMQELTQARNAARREEEARHRHPVSLRHKRWRHDEIRALRRSQQT